LGAAQAFAHDGLAQPARLVIRVRAHRLEDRRTRNIVEPDRAKRSELSICGDGHDVEFTAVNGNALDIPILFPALVFLIRMVSRFVFCKGRHKDLKQNQSQISQEMMAMDTHINIVR
jgi:hypothetical protein